LNCINNFITIDDGLTIDYPKYLRNTGDKIKVLQKHLSRKKKGSKIEVIMLYIS